MAKGGGVELTFTGILSTPAILERLFGSSHIRFSSENRNTFRRGKILQSYHCRVPKCCTCCKSHMAISNNNFSTRTKWRDIKLCLVFPANILLTLDQISGPKDTRKDT